MAEIGLDGSAMTAPEQFYDAFFAAAAGVLPDYGGRNLDALNDDLRELSEPLIIVWENSDGARNRLGEWFERCVSTLIEREPGDQPVRLLLR